MERKESNMNVLIHDLVILQKDQNAREDKGELLYKENGKTKYLLMDISEIGIFIIIDILFYSCMKNMHWVNILFLLVIGTIYAFRIHYHYNCSKYFIEIYQNYVLAQGARASCRDNEIAILKHELLQSDGAVSTIQGYQVCECKNGCKEVVIIFAERDGNKYKNQIILGKLNGQQIISALNMVDIKQI